MDSEMMREALALARRGEGRVEPNPMVGCVIASGRKILGEGFHRRFAGPHAEIVALGRSGGRLRRATVYVTLEPCCHEGKTPPCVDALIEAGVSRVVVGVRDPNPLVWGRGIGRLRAAGIQVEVGVESEAAAALIAPFATVQTLGRPYVIAKWAQGSDGSLVAPRGQPRGISCGVSLKFVHRLRARVDAIVVGSQTVLTDNPLLTARGVSIRRLAARVILDGRLRLGPGSNLVRSADQVPTLVFTSARRARSREAKVLSKRGVEIVTVRTRPGGLCLTAVMQTLVERGMTNVLVEGGPSILDSFLHAGIVDEAIAFVAPRRVGSTRWPQGRGCLRVELDPDQAEVARSGVDRRYHWRLTAPARP